MRLRPLVALAATAGMAFWAGCDSSDSPPSVARDGPVTTVPPLSGSYQVTGTTVDKSTGSERAVAGTVIFHAEDGAYTSKFSLATTLIGDGEPQRAEVVGSGEGSVVGRTLRGTAETQLIVALVPGVDPNFGFLPRTVTPRMVNLTETKIGQDGSIRVTIDSEPVRGEPSSPTRTVLRGQRMSPLGIGGNE